MRRTNTAVYFSKRMFHAHVDSKEVGVMVANAGVRWEHSAAAEDESEAKDVVLYSTAFLEHLSEPHGWPTTYVYHEVFLEVL